MSEKGGKQFSSRFWKPYDKLIFEKADSAKVKAAHLVRLAVMFFVDADILPMYDEIQETKREVKQLRREIAEFKKLILVNTR